MIKARWDIDPNDRNGHILMHLLNFNNMEAAIYIAEHPNFDARKLQLNLSFASLDPSEEKNRLMQVLALKLDFERSTPSILQLAMREGAWPVVEVIMTNSKLDVTKRFEREIDSPLTFSIKLNDLEMVRRMTSHRSFKVTPELKRMITKAERAEGPQITSAIIDHMKEAMAHWEASQVFGLAIFMCDGLLDLKPLEEA
jgi:hypothetical protein